jgi:hypothetical protein
MVECRVVISRLVHFIEASRHSGDKNVFLSSSFDLRKIICDFSLVNAVYF